MSRPLAPNPGTLPRDGAHSRPIDEPGSPVDVVERIRGFYRLWLTIADDIPDQGALAPSLIDIVHVTLPAHEAERYGAEDAYIASGFVVRGVYVKPTPSSSFGQGPTSNAFKTYEGSSFFYDRVSGEYRMHSSTIPAAVTRCEVPAHQSEEQHRKSSLSWYNAKSEQVDPVWIDSHNIRVDMSKWYAFPRSMVVRPNSNVRTDTDPLSKLWTENPNSVFHLPVEQGIVEHWQQLPGRSTLVGSQDERAKGSPSTPLFSPLRLRIVRGGHELASVTVIFRITLDDEGSPRPWRKGDDLPLRARVQDNLDLPPIDLSHPSPVGGVSPIEPRRARPEQYPGVARDLEAYRRSLGPDKDQLWASRSTSHMRHARESHSLSHRQQQIYGSRPFGSF